jgi:hypothetical protein
MKRRIAGAAAASLLLIVPALALPVFAEEPGTCPMSAEGAELLDSDGNPIVSAPETWLAQVAGCKKRPNGRCEGACPGKQICRMIKRPAKPDICQCGLR